MIVVLKAEFLLFLSFILSDVLVILLFQFYFVVVVSLSWGKQFEVMLYISLILLSHRKILMYLAVTLLFLTMWEVQSPFYSIYGNIEQNLLVKSKYI